MTAAVYCTNALRTVSRRKSTAFAKIIDRYPRSQMMTAYLCLRGTRQERQKSVSAIHPDMEGEANTLANIGNDPPPPLRRENERSIYLFVQELFLTLFISSLTQRK